MLSKSSVLLASDLLSGSRVERVAAAVDAAALDGLRRAVAWRRLVVGADTLLGGAGAILCAVARTVGVCRTVSRRDDLAR